MRRLRWRRHKTQTDAARPDWPRSHAMTRLRIKSGKEGKGIEHVQITKRLRLDRAILIGAFAGWNDAASAATWAVKFLINHWDAQPFAEIDPEIFYDFTETRPSVRVTAGALRRLSWPSNRFYLYHAATNE